MSFSQYSNFQMFSDDIFYDKICINLSKSCYRKNCYKFEFEFQRKLWVMGFQELGAYFVMKPSGCDIVRLCV